MGHNSVRACVLLASVALTLVASQQQVGAFDADKVYKYDFHGAITTKVADDDKPQYSGLSLSSGVFVKKTASDELTVKLDKSKLATFNDVIDDIHAYRYDYKPVEQALALEKPFKIYYEDGSVKSFDTYKDEPKWVTNFKRGLLSFFQLKFSSSNDNSLDASSVDGSGGATNGASGAGSGGGNSNSGNKQQDAGQYYTTTEKSVFGECETDYLVLSGVGSEDVVSYMNVTKTRNMAKCKTRFLHRFMPIDSSECYETERDLQQYKHSNAIFNFQLVGSRQSYVIKQVLLDEVSTFSPFGQKAHSHLVQSKFMLRLNEQATANEQAPSMSPEDGATRIDSLSYDPPELLNFYANINLDEDHHLSNIYQTRASVDQVMGVFDALVQEHRAYTNAFESANHGSSESSSSSNYQENSRLAELFIKLNELVGTMNSAKIEQLYSQVDERGEMHKKIFWDLMSVVGTNPSFMFMKKLITDGDAPSVKIKDFLTRLSYHIKMPSKSLFDEYVNLCKSDKIQTNQQYKRLCSLPLASLIHQHCAKPHAKYLRMQQEGTANATAYKKAQNTCQIATAEEYFSRLVQAPSSSGGNVEELTSIGDKMFNIKMAAELGVKPSVEYLMEIVRNKEEHPTLRSAAMWGLSKAQKIYPSLVKKLVIPYYYNSNELLELRIAAFYNWLYSGMSLHEMETLAKQLLHEPNRQLVIYIHSWIKSLADINSFPCTNSNEKMARLVLPTIKKALKNHAYSTISDSHASVMTTWQQEFGYGTATMTSAIFSNESMAPSNLYYASSEIMSGLKLSPKSISVQAHGLDKLIKRVVGINGLLADKESLMDVFSLKRRSRRQASSDELIKQEAAEIDKELKLGTREFSDVYLAVTISVYGRPITFFDKDSRELKKMLSEDGTIKIPQIKKLLHSFNNHTTQQMMISFEKLEVFNNELGLPLYQSINDFEYSTFKLNSIKLDVEPGFFKDERQGKPPTKLLAALDAKMGKHNEMFVSTGALLLNNKQQVGVGFYKKKLVNVPLKASIEANLLENKIQIKRQPIHESLLYIKQHPVTFVKSYDPTNLARFTSTPSASGMNNSGGRSAEEWRPLYDMNNVGQMKSFKLSYMTPLAVGFKLEGKHRLGEDWSMAAWRRHLSQVGMQAAKFMYFYSPTGKPMELRLSTITTDENPTKDLITSISWKHYHDSEARTELSEVDKDLELTTGKNQPDTPQTVGYKLALIGGSTKERKAGVEINYSRSFDRLLHKWRVFYQRTPLDQSAANSEVTNLCWTGQMSYPKYDIDKYLNFKLLDMDHSVNMTSELTFGDECSSSGDKSSADSSASPAKVAMKVAFNWSDEQRRMIEAALASEEQQQQAAANELQSEEAKKNTFLHMYRKCMKNRALSGARLEAACYYLLYKMSELTHISAVIDYKDVPDRWVKMGTTLGSLYTYARAGYIEEIDDKPHYRDYKSSDGKQDRAHLDANLTTNSYDRKLSYEFDTPKYHVMYKNLPVSIPPLSSFPLDDRSFQQMLQKRVSNRFCSVSKQTVTTFDNFTYQMPPVGDGCFKLITKDCSPESNFIVLGAKVGDGKVVKVYLAQKFKVEFVPDKDGKRISDIKVNGETVSIEANKKPLKRDTKLGVKKVEAFKIENNGAFYTLSSKLYKFSVSTDGTWIFVQQHKYYSGKSCGICGDANGDQLLEFKSPSSAQKVCKNANDFVWSYVLPSTCASRPTTIECA